MARRAEGWKLTQRGRYWYVRFTHAEKRYDLTTGETDSGKGSIRAAQIYADVVSGKVAVSARGLTHPGTALDELAAEWLAAVQSELGRNTEDTMLVYVRHWTRFFEVIGNVNTANGANYYRDRLGHVKRETVTKEIFALRRFMGWLAEQGHIREAPVLNLPGKKVLGTKHKQGRGQATPLTPAQVEAILALLPTWSRVRRGHRQPIRPFFVFLYETGLRPDAVELYEERDLSPFGFRIRDETDKNRWGRVITISPRARVIVESLLTGNPTAPLFGPMDRRAPFRKAAVAALGDFGKQVTPYDLKHARVTLWRNQGMNPLGIQWNTGVKEALENYMHPSRSAGDELFRGNSGEEPVVESCEGGDLNPYRSYPTSTSIESRDANQRENKENAQRESAVTGTTKPHSGEVHQNPAADFRRRSSEWFRRGAA